MAQAQKDKKADPYASKPTPMEQDFSVIAEQKIQENRDLALKGGKYNEAIENLLIVEKQTRQAEDAKSTSKLCIAIVKICFEAKQWDLLNEKLVQLSKRRGQLKMAVKDMVTEAMTYIDQAPNAEGRMQLITTLRTISEGKIYVENERARVTKILATLREKEGKIGEAAKILQELQVETYGSMEKQEKVDFILEQMRLTLDHKDYIRANIISNKITRKVLNDPDMQDHKLRFFEHLIRYQSHEANFLEICKSYQAIYDTPVIKNDKEKRAHALRMVCIYLVLSPHGNEQSDMLHRIEQDTNLAEQPRFKDLLKCFTTVELIRWPKLVEIYGHDLTQYPHLFPLGDTKGGLWGEFQKRVVEHNVRVVSTYYTRITAKHLSELLDLSEEDAEKCVSDLVSKKSIYAKIDRPTGVVVFQKRHEPSEVLNEWSENVTGLLNLIEKTTHLISRELMVRAAKVDGMEE